MNRSGLAPMTATGKVMRAKLVGMLLLLSSLPAACDDADDRVGAAGGAGSSVLPHGGGSIGVGGERDELGGSGSGGVASQAGALAGGAAGALAGGEGGAAAGGEGGAAAGGEGGASGGQGGADAGPDPDPRCAAASESSLQGAGTEQDPYLFCLPAQLALFGTGSYGLAAAYAVGQDLDVAALPQSSLGDGTGALAGSLDGRERHIDHMNATLLSQIAVGGEVRNLYLSGELASGKPRGLLATFNDGAVRNVHAAGTFSLADHAGVLVGYNAGAVEGCSASGTISMALNHVGGLVGQNTGTISQSWSNVAVTAGNRVGGLVGNLTSPGSIRESYALGPVSGAFAVGGLVGTSFGGEVRDSLARAQLVSGPKAGGLVGLVAGDTTLTRCYSASMLAGADGRGLVGSFAEGFSLTATSSYFLDTASDTVGTALSPQAMQSEASFVGWDFVNVWSFEPTLSIFPSLVRAR